MMIQTLGIDHSVPIDVRERFSVVSKRIEVHLDRLVNILEEVVILSTCNRTEIYFIADKMEDVLEQEIFGAMGWDMSFKDYVFYMEEDESIRHLMNLVCGFDSLIKGEDQILSQIKGAYDKALQNGSVGSELSRLFKKVIRCGKEFRQKTELYKIPVSYSSISVKESTKRGLGRFMIVGYGEVGKLALKYILSSKFEKIFVVIREDSEPDFFDPRVEFITFQEKEKYYKYVECIISATSAPHPVIEYHPDLRRKLIFDLAVPRDVSEELYSSGEFEILNIDRLDEMDQENQRRRSEMMLKHSYIIDKYISEFEEWKSTKEIIPYILAMEEKKRAVVDKRAKDFRNKRHSKDVDELAKTLIDSSANVYVNRAIETLKEEYLNGRGQECLNLIKKIFM